MNLIMDYSPEISLPFLFNPMKHHLSGIREFISIYISRDIHSDRSLLLREMKRIGSSVTDVYTGMLTPEEICKEILVFLEQNGLTGHDLFLAWTGTNFSDYKTITLSDTSVRMLKYHNDPARFVHIFPARSGPYSFRVKANTLKSAILYYILIGKDFISRDDLNEARKLIGLSPVRTTSDAEAITEMIDALRVERSE